MLLKNKTKIPSYEKFSGGFFRSQIPEIKKITNFSAHGVKVLLIDPGLCGTTFWGRPSDLEMEMP